MEGHPLSKELETTHWEEYDKTIEKFIQVIAKNMNLYGITPSIGRLYGVLYFAEEPMTLDDMRDALSMSKTSMSTGVRTLTDMNMVESVFRRGIRKDLYQAEEDWYKSFTTLFGTRWRKTTESNLEEAKETLENLTHLFEETNDEMLKLKIQEDLKKLEYAMGYYQWLLNFIKVVETGEIFKLIPKSNDQLRNCLIKR